VRLVHCQACKNKKFMENRTTDEGNEIHVCLKCNEKYIWVDGILYVLAKLN